MKAQFSIEYFTSLVLFVGFIAYIFLQVLKFTPAYLGELKNEETRSEAYQVSEILVNDAGEPLNWNWESVADSSIRRIGLLDPQYNKTNLLSAAKVSAFQTKCQSSFSNVQGWIGTDHQFSILLTDKLNSQILIDCRPSVVTGRPINVSVRRVVALGTNSYGELIVQMW